MNEQGGPQDGVGVRVLADGFADRVGSLSLAELRDVRGEAEQEEAELSCLRRLLQGRIDILVAELARRGRVADGEGSVASLVTDLPHILGDTPRPGPRGMGRHSSVEPMRISEHERRVEQLAGDVGIADAGARTDDEIETALARLRAAEHEVSEGRARLHAGLDACTAEITRRYRDGEADVDALLSEQPPA